MSELKTVYSKLFKTELASQKVELASVKELDSYLSDGKSQIAEIEKQGAVLGKKLAEAISERRKFQDMVSSLKTLSFVGAKQAVEDFKSKAKDLGVDVVMECTGVFNSKAKSIAHIEAGAKKVVLSAPGDKDVDATVVFGNTKFVFRNFTRLFD